MCKKSVFEPSLCFKVPADGAAIWYLHRMARPHLLPRPSTPPPSGQLAYGHGYSDHRGSSANHHNQIIDTGASTSGIPRKPSPSWGGPVRHRTRLFAFWWSSQGSRDQSPRSSRHRRMDKPYHSSRRSRSRDPSRDSSLQGIIITESPGGQSPSYEWKLFSGELLHSRKDTPLFTSLSMRNIWTTSVPRALLTPFGAPYSVVGPTRTPSPCLGSPDTKGRPWIHMAPPLLQCWGLVPVLHLLLQCQQPALRVWPFRLLLCYKRSLILL